jgi:hypothetical protein
VQAQFFPYIKGELSLTDIPLISITLRTPSRPLTIPPSLPDKLPSVLKKLLMPGERDLLQTQDQFFP